MLEWELHSLAGDFLGRIGRRSRGQVTVPLCDRRYAQVSIPIDDPLGEVIAPLAVVLRAYWWGRPIFAGPVQLPRFIEQEDRIELNAMDPGFRLARSFVNQRLDGGLLAFQAAVDQSELMARLVDHGQPSGGRRADAGAWPIPVQRGTFAAPAVLRDRGYEAGKEIWEGVSELSEVQGGADFELEPLDPQAVLFTEDFEGGIGGWTQGGAGGAATYSSAVDRVYAGTKSAKIDLAAGAPGDRYIYKDFTLPVGLHMVEVYASYTAIAGVGSPAVNLEPVIGEAYFVCDDVLPLTPPSLAAGTFRPLRAFVSVRTAGTFRVYLQLGYNGNTSGQVWFDQLRIKPIALAKLNTYAPQQGSDKTGSVRFTAGYAHENATVLWEPAGDTVVNRATLQGQTEEGQPPATYTSDQSDSERAIGTYASFEGRPDMSVSDSLQEVAQGKVSAAAFPIDFFDIIPAVEGTGYTRDATTGKLLPIKGRTFGTPPRFGPGPDFDYWLGDTVACYARRGAIDGVFTGRVTDAVISEVDETGDAVVALTMGPVIPAYSVT